MIIQAQNICYIVLATIYVLLGFSLPDYLMRVYAIQGLTMHEALSAVILFWAAFTISAGPFWTAMMTAATTTSFVQIYKDYVIYLVVGWLSVITFIGLIISHIGGLNENINIALHFIGAIIIFYMGFKILRSKPGTTGSFKFGWKAMTLITWTNPKVFLLIPIGFLGAKFSDSVWINIGLFYIIGVPFFLAGTYCWGMIGRLGAKISLEHINKFNAFLMASFGVLLIFRGWQLLNA